jgi:hypothetical protein
VAVAVAVAVKLLVPQELDPMAVELAGKMQLEIQVAQIQVAELVEQVGVIEMLLLAVLVL